MNKFTTFTRNEKEEMHLLTKSHEDKKYFQFIYKKEDKKK